MTLTKPFLFLLGGLLFFTGFAQAGPALPAPAFQIQGSFNDGIIDHGLLFLAARNAESVDPDVRIFRLGKGNKPLLLGNYISKDYANSIALNGNYLYVVDGKFGLEVVDISHPSAPRLAGFIGLDGYSHKVLINNKTAYVTSGFNGLHIIDVSVPTHPRLISTFQAYPPPGDDTANQVSDSDVIVDVPEDYDNERESSGGGDVIVSWEELIRDEGALDIAINGHTAYIAYGSAGVVMVDIANPAKPRKISTLHVDKMAESIFYNHGTLYITAGLQGLQLIDTTHPASPKAIGGILTNCYPRDVEVFSKQIFVADGSCGVKGLSVFDVDKHHALKENHSYDGDIGNVRISENVLLSMGIKKTRAYLLSNQDKR